MKVLIAEDDESQRRALSRVIRSNFCDSSVEVFVNGKLAWEAFQKAPDVYDLVITDFKMPHMRGDELIRNIRLLRPDQKILLHSGDNMTKQAVELGVAFAEKNTSIDWEDVLSRLGFSV